MTEILDATIKQKEVTALGRFFILISNPETEAEPGKFARDLRELPRAKASAIAKAALHELFDGEDAALADAKYKEGEHQLVSRSRTDSLSPEIRFYAYVQQLSETSSLVHDIASPS